MDVAERKALSALRFNWAPTPDDVWRPPAFHVDGLHRDSLQVIMEGFGDARENIESSPIGVVVQGQRGSGKTHLLSSLREQVQAAGGYFFLISLLEASAFWRSAALSMLEGFAREDEDGDSQLKRFLRRLVDEIDAPRTVRRAVVGASELSRATLDAFVDLLRKTNRQVGIDCQDTARALALRAAEDTSAQDIGHEFLGSNDEENPGERASWGMRKGRRSAQEVVRDVSRLLALTGPTVIAVDQIDMLIAQSAKSTAGQARPQWQEALLLEQIAGGLMSLRETTRRTLSVVTCLPVSWEQIKTQATDTVQDRFREAIQLGAIPSAELGHELVAKRFTAKFAQTEFAAPYPTWPVLPPAFADAVDFTPRGLLRVVDSHVRACLAAGEVRELARLAPESGPLPATAPDAGMSASGFAEIDARYAELVKTADTSEALDPATEDHAVPDLLEAGLTAWIAEQGEPTERFGLDPVARSKPPLHARIRQVLDENTEDQAHWSFRAIGAPHHIAVLNRIKNASTAAGLTEGVTKRRLFLLRNAPWSAGARTKEVRKAFREAGGRELTFPESDVAQLSALKGLLAERGYEPLLPWFRARRPTESIDFLREAFEEAAPLALAPVAAAAPAAAPAEVAVALTVAAPVAVAPPSAAAESDRRLIVGSAVDGGRAVGIDLEALRKHTAIFAGSGSGKTVLIRRLVEECALRGVSAIVLDPNNDLARLGEPWPTPPDGWNPADTARAEDYVANTDVVVWTPGLESGRPLSFQPLPDFAEMLDDPDAFAAGIDSAVAALSPRAMVDGAAGKARLGRAVLKEALTSYARTGSSDLRGFIALLNALPDGMSQIDDAEKIGAGMAQLLTATTVTDPLFGGSGAPVDPGVLLTPRPGCRARVSVINFVGLADEGQRQSFVNQLQLALFAWIKRNPAGDRPLGGLFVMDEAQTLAPSGPMTACTHSTLALASQARKYGLGLVFATQAPKGLHNRIPGNASTQFFGLLNHPTQINAARELARAKGSDVSDIARLRTGQFYAAVEGAEFVKLQAPWCLTRHPQSPLTTEEVLERTRRE
jgi:hypothetical protein